jgi:hypothetical protein
MPNEQEEGRKTMLSSPLKIPIIKSIMGRMPVAA